MKKIIVSVFVSCFFTLSFSQAQESANKQSQHTTKHQYTYNLEEVLNLAQEQSLDAMRAKNTFLSNYWQYRSYRASQLPSLNFSANLPDFARQFSSAQYVTDSSTTTVYRETFQNSINGRLSIDQNLPTGGKVSLYTSLDRQDNFKTNFSNHIGTTYQAQPISISISQSIFGVNQWKWDRKIEPLRYEEAKRNYLKQTEDVALRAIQYFFSLAAAQQNLAIAEFNYANNDTLHKISRGRYNIGTIGENDLLQSELNFMNAASALNEAILEMETAQNRLRSYLGFNESVTVNIIIPQHVPNITLDMEQVMQLAKKNNPDLLAYQRQLIEAEKNVATERSSTGFQANVSLTFGLNQADKDELPEVYKNLNDMESARITLSVPILDWGRGKGRVRMAKSNQQVVQSQVEQAYADFEQDIVLRVRQFNLQDSQFEIAAKSDTIAQKRYDASKQRYLIDKITITDMNNAQLDRDRSKQSYVAALRNYWNYYYQIRQIALYDFIANKPLEVEYDEILK